MKNNLEDFLLQQTVTTGRDSNDLKIPNYSSVEGQSHLYALQACMAARGTSLYFPWKAFRNECTDAVEDCLESRTLGVLCLWKPRFSCHQISKQEVTKTFFLGGCMALQGCMTVWVYGTKAPVFIWYNLRLGKEETAMFCAHLQQELSMVCHSKSVITGWLCMHIYFLGNWRCRVLNQK